MSKHWKQKTIEECFKVKSGNFLPQKKMVLTGDIDVYGGNGITGKHDQYNLTGENIIIGRVGAKCGNVNRVNESIWVTDNAFYISKLTEEFDLTFLEYLLNTKNLRATANQSAQPVISYKTIKNVLLPIPPLAEQKKIVAILDEVFEGIDVAIANTEKNLTNTRELFESYLNTIFTRKGNDWKEVELGLLSERITKGSSPKWQGISYVNEPGVLFVTSENVGQNRMIYDKNKYVEDAFNRKDSKSILSIGDVLTNIVGASIGRTAIYDRDDLANINQAVCLIRCMPEKLSNKYLSYLLNSPYFRKILHDNEINNARANLSLTFFRRLKIPLPSLQEQQDIVSRMDAMSTETQLLEAIYEQKLSSLNELKQSILQKAFSGELTTDTANQATKAAKEVAAA